jgi:hypothetical protein
MSWLRHPESTDRGASRVSPLPIIILCLLAAILIAACGGAGPANGVAMLPSASASGGSASAKPSASVDPRTAMLPFSQCMREHGVTNFPDPQANGSLSISFDPSKGDVDPNSPTMQAAQTACEALMPKVSESSADQKQHYEQALAFSKCIREHGVPNFPDPQQAGTGGTVVRVGEPGSGGGFDPESPTFKTAMQACQSLIPAGGQLTTNTGGKP